MKAVLYIVTMAAVVGLAFWAYRENYATQKALSETDTLHRNIQQAHARLAVLRAEWAYLNRPDRLRTLAKMNYDDLGLLALSPDQFSRVDQVAYPKLPFLDLSNSVDVSTMSAAEADQ